MHSDRTLGPIHLGKACRTIIADHYGAPVAPQTGARWASKGLKAPDGTLVKLKAFKVGRQLVTTPHWVEEFFAELQRRSGLCSPAEAATLKSAAVTLYGDRCNSDQSDADVRAKGRD